MALVSADWLYNNLDDPKLIVLDASLANPVAKNIDYTIDVIPNAVFFDLERRFSDLDSDLPHMMISESKFNREAQLLGIDNDNTVVIYDNKGVYSSARVWWMFRSMGFDAYVLDGGLVEWKKCGFPTVALHLKAEKAGDFLATSKSGYFVSKKEVEHAIAQKSAQVFDLRHPNRFNALEDEPRKGLLRGNIPTSINMHFAEFTNGARMKSREDLTALLADFPKDTNLIFSCGSGVTACIGALAATVVGYFSVSVYDGSWSEWGIPKQFES
ncbi:sulfurtransferase [Flavobacterium sp. MAH-1]|uniref:Sulfurtransferase n=1 Tax=Flavobacterium agri TaxID=2743471 RepID=A0A7Y9C4E3_9FLAO|nr:sulfurtransferase [Flavobacterium agri]NUY79800.1 sulfurtransferase [Flavobacterium agri]NYA69825.1 sulfurtransferase [Flavobacterium agri]